jgi:hypothetical protein
MQPLYVIRRRSAKLPGYKGTFLDRETPLAAQVFEAIGKGDNEDRKDSKER